MRSQLDALVRHQLEQFLDHRRVCLMFDHAPTRALIDELGRRIVSMNKSVGTLPLPQSAAVAAAEARIHIGALDLALAHVLEMLDRQIHHMTKDQHTGERCLPSRIKGHLRLVHSR